MKERPILFNAPMVRAILEGRKTQTRRVVKPQPLNVSGPNFDGHWAETNDPVVRYFGCPYGQPGDRLWVRETWCSMTDIRIVQNVEHIQYRADFAEDTYTRWRPSIHMPRWASRITLEITSIRVERVQDITEEDAWTEGFPDPAGKNREYPDRARYWFKNLWDSINSKRGFGWDANPWVWAITFKKL